MAGQVQPAIVATRAYCPAGHALVSKVGRTHLFTKSRHHVCAQCGAVLSSGVQRHSCKQCEFNLCDTCCAGACAPASYASLTPFTAAPASPAAGVAGWQPQPLAGFATGTTMVPKLWFYLDSQGHDCGPFPGHMMLQWLQAGQFPVGERLLVRLQDWRGFFPVQELHDGDLAALMLHGRWRQPGAAIPHGASATYGGPLTHTSSASSCPEGGSRARPRSVTAPRVSVIGDAAALHVGGGGDAGGGGGCSGGAGYPGARARARSSHDGRRPSHEDHEMRPMPSSRRTVTLEGAAGAVVSVACGACPVVMHVKIPLGHSASSAPINCACCGRSGKLGVGFVDLGAPGDDVRLPVTWGEDVGLAMGLNSMREQVPQSVLRAMKAVIEATWKGTTTRDRGFKSVPKLEVVQVLRNESPRLWRIYQRCLARLARELRLTPEEQVHFKTSTLVRDLDAAGLPPCLNPTVNEGFLLHGTKPSAADHICKEDFRVSLAGSSTGTLYGPGIYLAESSSKSDEYAEDDPDGLYQGLFAMLVCRVACGRCFYTDETTPDVNRLTQACTAKGARFHSVLGDREKTRGTYREFVIFSNAQVYPEYVVIYRRLDELEGAGD
eukprot:NODE_3257_length_2065_cov_4.490712.p1 GENE.NODE_3257_length_2065_cov_4.490712~~NODE_3257_length_2065_cov_4.490712.p1  ORF type:complete len:636 (+),score=113.98 NODE_3257_length_2065_cov_4.490712:90-1910(+)